MFIKKPTHRIFDYTPRFYKPEDDQKEKRKKKLGFSRQLKISRKKRSPAVWLLLVVIAIFIYLKLSGIV